MDINLILAILGVLIAAIALIYAFGKDWLDRPSVKVRAERSTFWYVADITTEDIAVVLVNNRKRPITITTIGFQMTGENELHDFDTAYIRDNHLLPVTIEESNEARIHVHRVNIIRPNDVKYLFARDTSQRVFKSDRFPLRKLRNPEKTGMIREIRDS
jgi:hypothetical protein